MSDVREIASHTIDVDLLPEAPLVLDVGCRDFQFDIEILKLRPAAIITALDPDPTIEPPKDDRIRFICAALTDQPGDKVEWVSCGEASRVVTGKDFNALAQGAVRVEVRNLHLEDINIEANLRRLGPLDLVKLDCEGSEFGLLEHWPGPIATQISVEFHDWTDLNRYPDTYYEQLLQGPLRHYRVVKHKLTPIGPGKHLGHWDSLFVLK